MNKRLLCLLTLLFLATGTFAEAQQTRKVARIGFLNAPPLASISARIEAFRQGLRELGYVEGKNIVIEYRSAEGKAERVPDLAAELVRLKVDVIVSCGPTSTPIKPRRRRARFPSSWHSMMTLLVRGSSPVLRNRAVTLLDCQLFPRS